MRQYNVKFSTFSSVKVDQRLEAILHLFTGKVADSILDPLAVSAYDEGYAYERDLVLSDIPSELKALVDEEDWDELEELVHQALLSAYQAGEEQGEDDRGDGLTSDH